MQPPVPVANGIRTDHPIPGLPFVNDSLLDLEDPLAIEAIGRHAGAGLWGRTDLYRSVANAWRAFTTDPQNTEYAWVVINHPTNGRTVTLYRDDDGVSAYSYRDYDNDGVIPLIVRAGGYWSDGDQWRRPTATRDPISSLPLWDTPPGAENWTVPQARLKPLPGDEAHLPDLHARTVASPLPESIDDSQWRAVELAAWEEARAERDDALAVERCIVEIVAPELTGTSLFGSSEAASRAGVGASTWRAYVARGTAPAPQRVRSGRPHWARPIIEAYVARAERNAPRPVPSVPEDAAMTVDRIREDIYRAGRKAFKPGQTDAVRNTLADQVIGLCSNTYHVASMHAAWILHEFKDSWASGSKTVPPYVLEQIESLAWLNRHTAENALSTYILRGLEDGHSRNDLRNALLDEAAPGSEVHTLIKEAITPHWG